MEIFFYVNLILSYMLLRQSRAYPGIELVVAKTLAKWKKLEPNEINLPKF